MDERREVAMAFVRRLLIVLVGAAPLLGAACGGPDFTPPDVGADPDDAIATFIGPNGVPAVAVAVVDNGETLYTKVAGTRKVGSGVAVMDDDAFLLNSNTKAITALMAGSVVDAGQLAWNSTVGGVLTGTVTVGAPYRDVTLTQLLDHTSGLPSALVDADWESFFTMAALAAPVHDERRRMAELALALPPMSAPGTEFLYSNMGYIVAGLMLEVATGSSWETLVQDRLFGPLAMSHAGFGYPATPGTIDAPWGHDPAPRPPESSNFPPAADPFFGVHASIGDLLSYVGLYFDGGLGPNGPIVSASALAQIETPEIADSYGYYGFGWIVEQDFEGRTVLLHLGTDGTFCSTIVVIPDRRAAVIAMTNVGPAAARLNQINSYLFGHFLHCDGTPDSTPPKDAAGDAEMILQIGSLCLHSSI
jgi:CubicO group peptidase (beta-lactamase class C family)